jgi:hypothetical protein
MAEWTRRDSFHERADLPGERFSLRYLGVEQNSEPGQAQNSWVTPFQL